MIPVMKAHGTNTAVNTRPTAITGAETSSMALIVAARGFIPCSMWCSTDSTTTIASSTTMPIASTRPNSVRLLMLKPIASMTANVPMIATGTAIKGITADRQFCRNKQHDDRDQDDRVAQRVEDFPDRFADIGRGVVADDVIETVGKVSS